ncbi:hypothetical protein I4F81_002365 [Pyropia yezoensis]|uniref:Uncharacterized protein n=1 Tax=Pyropia yezoensis TaxID=2788 RepID=A0ACC3BP79_PYRYE|nr:hypothetical protein I4F81_002365 [Neopyropia yezoensis]
MGLGVPNGCEQVLHEVDAALAAHPEWGIVQMDFANAFNNVIRVAAPAIIKHAFPLQVPYVRWMYGQMSPTVYGWEEESDGPGELGLRARLSLLVERGAQQGDPQGPLLHAAALHLVLCRLDEETGLTIRAFHDDVIAVGPVELLGGLMRAAATYGATVDAHLALAKCRAWSPSGCPSLADLTAQWAGREITQFSVPLGSEEFVVDAVAALVDDHAAAVAAITALPQEEVQSQLVRLRMCATPRASYFFRFLAPADGVSLATAVDAISRPAPDTLLCGPGDTPATRATIYARAALPVRMEVLGLGDRALVVSVAHAASWLDTLRAVERYSCQIELLANAVASLPPPASPSCESVKSRPLVGPQWR